MRPLTTTVEADDSQSFASFDRKIDVSKYRLGGIGIGEPKVLCLDFHPSLKPCRLVLNLFQRGLGSQSARELPCCPFITMCGLECLAVCSEHKYHLKSGFQSCHKFPDGIEETFGCALVQADRAEGQVG